MLFNSLEFVFFFGVVTSLFFVLPHKYRWLLLLLSSCYFYMDFMPIYVLILGFTIVVDYFAGIFIDKSEGKRRKVYLILSIIANVGILGFFKYFNFLNENVTAFLGVFNYHNPVQNTTFPLPIGLSFHTFQAMSYTIEVYRGNQKSEKKFGIYALYVMFYPQLVAGPIERPQNIIHQFYKPQKFEYNRVVMGLKIMLWGFFKKLVIADRMGIYVNTVYGSPEHHSGFTLFVATLFFGFQDYCDFSGYSDIAIGSAKVMGFNLMENFRRPFFGKSITEKCLRWHISLYTWFRDYIYTPLSMKGKKSKGKMFFNVLLIFTLSGLWHGAAWTFLVWGFLTGAFIVIERIYQSAVRPKRFLKGFWLIFLGTSVSFIMYMPTALFFRAQSIGDALLILRKIVTLDGTRLFKGEPPSAFWYCFWVGWFLLIVEFFQEYYPKVKVIGHPNIAVRFTAYVALLTILLMIGVFSGSQFIYFQF